ncbi:hypothetical protein ABFV59_23165, partial [Pseudomonas silesiensis]
TVRTGQSRNRAFSPAHPFKSKHTSELAREEAGTFTTDVGGYDAFASKLAPTGFSSILKLVQT